MYKLLLCWRYLRTRYLALVCIVSVMLGVATLIVVNSVMAGFSTKLKERLHGLLSDIVVEAARHRRLPRPRRQDAAHPRIVGRQIRRGHDADDGGLRHAAVPGAHASTARRVVTKTVKLIGVDPKTRTEVGGFAEFLYALDISQPDAAELAPGGAEFRSDASDALARFNALLACRRRAGARPGRGRPERPAAGRAVGDMPTKQITGAAFVGHALASFRDRTAKPGEVKDLYMLAPGDVIDITTVSGVSADEGGRLSGVRDRFVVDRLLQVGDERVRLQLRLRAARIPADAPRHARPGHQHPDQADRLRPRRRGPRRTAASCSRRTRYIGADLGRQAGRLLAAIAIEKGILNVLLFMIVGVAGFGILAIFTMIVVEKTRDIGILKALGASNRGVMRIFLGYGLLLGIVGAGLGTIAGLAVTWNINEIEQIAHRS